MEKVITIANKNWKMKSSALTQFSYKDFTGRSFLSDLKSLIDYKSEKKDFQIDELDKITEMMLQVTYTLVKEYDKEHSETQATDYNDLLSKIDNLYDDDKWIYDVLELACTPLSGRLQINKK